MKAVLCPVCNGVGKVSAGFYNRGGDCQFWVSGTTYPELCRSCNGRGWVEVNDDPYIGGGIPQPFIDPNKCPSCGGDKNSPALTGCPMGSHYGSYCSV